MDSKYLSDEYLKLMNFTYSFGIEMVKNNYLCIS